MNEPVELTLGEGGVPAAMRRGATEYEVVDTPTRVELEPYFVTHPPPARLGWRFTARSADDIRVFDVFGGAGGAGWRLVHEYL